MSPRVSSFCLLLFVVQKTCGHGRLLEPPSRASMWRMGFNTPENFDDDQTYCGGWGVQWNENGGRCGICGDPWKDFPREHEAPYGKFATGTIVRQYTSGSWIPVIVDITTNHGGYFSFKLCPNNDISEDPSQRCFDDYVLKTGKNRATEQLLSTDLMGPTTLYVKLPENVTCHQCIIQWTWIAANNWGTCYDGARGMGCGPQETFRSCADVSISKKSGRQNTKVEKMELMKKLYYLMKKRAKEKSSMLTRLKLMKLKREMIHKREVAAKEKSHEKTTQRLGARDLKIEESEIKEFKNENESKTYGHDDNDIDGINIKSNIFEENQIMNDRTIDKYFENKDNIENGILKRNNNDKYNQWKKLQKRKVETRSLDSDRKRKKKKQRPANLQSLLPKGTTSRSIIQNHINNLRKHRLPHKPHTANQLSRPQIGASDLKTYLTVNPNDLPPFQQKKETLSSERRLELLRLLLTRKISNMRLNVLDENKNSRDENKKFSDENKNSADVNKNSVDENMKSRDKNNNYWDEKKNYKPTKVQNSDKQPETVNGVNKKQSENLVKTEEIKGETESVQQLNKSEQPKQNHLVLPWWMRIIIQDKHKFQ